MSPLEIELLKQYTTNLYNRNLKVFNSEITCVDYFVNEAYSIHPNSFDLAKKIVVDRILTERRRQIAKIQQNESLNKFDFRSKKCASCGELKHISEFKPRIDKKTDYHYYTSYCVECERERRRLSYSNSEQQKISNRERQRTWRERNRNLKAA